MVSDRRLGQWTYRRETLEEELSKQLEHVEIDNRTVVNTTGAAFSMQYMLEGRHC